MHLSKVNKLPYDTSTLGQYVSFPSTSLLLPFLNDNKLSFCPSTSVLAHPVLLQSIGSTLSIYVVIRGVKGRFLSAKKGKWLREKHVSCAIFLEEGDFYQIVENTKEYAVF